MVVETTPLHSDKTIWAQKIADETSSEQLWVEAKRIFMTNKTKLII